MWVFLDIAFYRSLAELRAESKRSYAGLLWWVIRPLLSLCVYGIFFQLIIKVQQESFLLFLFSGIIAWEWFASSTLRCANSIISNRSLMLLVKVNPALFPMSICLIDLVKFLLGLCVLLTAILLWGNGLTWMMLIYLPVIIISELFLCFGTGLLVASVTPLFPDFALILATMLQLLMFMSGVFYRVSTLPESLKSFMQLNPVAMLLEQYRLILLEHTAPDFTALLLIWGISIAGIVIGWRLVTRFEKIYAKIW